MKLSKVNKWNNYFKIAISIDVLLNYLVDILLNAAGNAPIMKQRKWTVDWQKDINWVCKFIHKYLKLDSEEKLVSKNSEEN